MASRKQSDFAARSLQGNEYVGTFVPGVAENFRTPVSEFIFDQRVTATGGSKERLVADHFGADVANLKNFNGVDGGGSVNNRLPLIAALTTTRKRLIVPAGTYRVNLLSATGMPTLPEGLLIEGDGDESVIEFHLANTTYANIFTIGNAGVRFRDIKLKVVSVATGSYSLFAISAGEFSADDVTLESDVARSGGVATATAYLFNLSTTAEVSDFRLRNSRVTKWSWPFLKTNAAVSTNRRFRVQDNYFLNNDREQISFNSPNGVFDDVLISGNTIKREAGATINHKTGAETALEIALASVTNARVVDNTIDTFNDQDAIHIEEGCRGVTIRGNVIDVTSSGTDGNGIYVNDNDVGDAETPSDIVIDGNVIRRAGGTEDGAGILLVADVSAEAPVSRAIVANNVIEGFEKGIGFYIPNYDNQIKHNTIRICTWGLYGGQATPAMRDNLVVDCDHLIRANSGMLGEQHLFNTPSIVDELPTGGIFKMLGWTIQKTGITLASGVTTAIDLVPLGSRFAGVLSFTASFSETIFVSGEYNIAYDGTTVICTQISEVEGGGLALSGVADTTVTDNAGMLAVGVFASAERVGVTLFARLTGHHTFL